MRKYEPSTGRLTFEELCKRLMIEADLSYQQTGERMGFPRHVARQMVYRFIKNKRPSARKLVLFANAVGARLEELL